MICKIQVVTLGEDGRQETREIACLERTDLKPETLGLTLAEAKAILKGLQAIVVEGQVSTHLPSQRPCPDCGGLRALKGYHDLTVKTVFGALTIKSPRLLHCACRPHETKDVQPLGRNASGPHAARVAFPGDQVGFAHELRHDVETLAGGPADRRTRQHLHAWRAGDYGGSGRDTLRRRPELRIPTSEHLLPFTA